MNRLFMQFSPLLAVLLLGVVFTGCDKGEEPGGGEQSAIKPFTLTLSGSTVTDFSLEVDYDDSKESLTYLVGVVPSSVGATDSAIIAAVLEALDDKDVDIDEIDNRYVFCGDATANLATAWSLEYETSYTVAVFAIDSKETLLTNVETESFTTDEEPDVVAGEIGEIKVSDVTLDDAHVEISAGGYEDIYYAAVISTYLFDSKYNSDLETLVEGLIAQEYEYFDPDFTVADGQYTFKGDAVFNVNGLWNIYPGEEFKVYAFGIDEKGVATTEVAVSAPFNTQPLSIVNIDIDIDKVGDNSVEATFTPDSSNDNLLYYFGVVSAEEVVDMSDKDIVDLCFYGNNEFQFLEANGAYTVTNNILDSGTEYYAVGFSAYYMFGTADVCFKVPFTTTGEKVIIPELPTKVEIPNVEFGEIEISAITTDGFDFAIKLADKSTGYIFDCVEASAFDAFDSDEAFILSELKKIADKGEASDYTYGEYLPYALWANDYSSYKMGLTSGATYVMWGFGVDTTTGQPSTKLVVERVTIL